MIVMKNEYLVKGDYAEVSTASGKTFLVDVEDLPIIRDSLSKWNAIYNKTGDSWYVVANINRKTTYLHRYLLNVTVREVQVDHINHDPLDNRRSNLRIASDGQNKQNRGKLDKRNKSGVRGVFWNSQKNKWNAKLAFKNKPQMHVGFFDSLEEAESAVKEARRQHMSFSPEATADEPFTDIDLNKSGWGRKSKSGVPGVCWDKRSNKWMGLFQHNKKQVYLGKFDSIDEAADAVKKAKEQLIIH